MKRTPKINWQNTVPLMTCLATRNTLKKNRSNDLLVKWHFLYLTLWLEYETWLHRLDTLSGVPCSQVCNAELPTRSYFWTLTRNACGVRWKIVPSWGRGRRALWSPPSTRLPTRNCIRKWQRIRQWCSDRMVFCLLEMSIIFLERNFDSDATELVTLFSMACTRAASRRVYRGCSRRSPRKRE